MRHKWPGEIPTSLTRVHGGARALSEIRFSNFSRIQPCSRSAQTINEVNLGIPLQRAVLIFYSLANFQIFPFPLELGNKMRDCSGKNPIRVRGHKRRGKKSKLPGCQSRKLRKFFQGKRLVELHTVAAPLFSAPLFLC